MGIFGDMFDFNGDGNLDAFEQGAELGFLAHMIDSEKKDELTSAGLDPSELELMDDSDRREALENAGLDPDEYDF